MPELRRDPVNNRWVIMATERSERPNAVDLAPAWPGPEDPAGDPFAEGNEQHTPPEIYAVRDKHSAPNGPGWQVRVVPNKFPALRIEGGLNRRGHGMYDSMNGVGAHEVVIETPLSNVGLHELELTQLHQVVETYRVRIEDLCHDKRFAYVLVFKNHGTSAGASLGHAHSQVIATPIVPKRVLEELSGAKAHWKLKRRSIFMDILDQELDSGERLVYQNGQMVAVCPYASTFPFEIHIYPRHQCADFRKASPEELAGLADALKVCLGKLLRSLGDVSYNFLLHTAPNDSSLGGADEDFPLLDAYYHWHIELFPRLARTAGFEWGTGFYINPTTPEDAAKFMRELED